MGVDICIIIYKTYMQTHIICGFNTVPKTAEGAKAAGKGTGASGKTKQVLGDLCRIVISEY